MASLARTPGAGVSRVPAAAGRSAGPSARAAAAGPPRLPRGPIGACRQSTGSIVTARLQPGNAGPPAGPAGPPPGPRPALCSLACGAAAAARLGARERLQSASAGRRAGASPAHPVVSRRSVVVSASSAAAGGYGLPPPPALSETDAAREASGLRALLVAHALSCAGTRAWEFASAMLLMAINGGHSLVLVAVYGLVDGLLRVALSAPLGREIDKLPRLAGAAGTAIARHACVSVAAACACGLLGRGPGAAATGLDGLLLGGAVLCGALSSVASIGNKVAVEREWPKAICGSDAGRLASLNSLLRAIDLACSVAAPAGAGMLMTAYGVRAAAVAICAWSAVAWLPEIILLRRARNRAHALQGPRPSAAAVLQATTSAGPARRPPPGLLADWTDAWEIYGRQSVMLPAMGLAILYFTVLSTAGSLMPAYLKWSGLSELAISHFRGAGAMAGLAATALFPMFVRSFGLRRVAAGAVTTQLVCVLLSALPVVIASAATGGRVASSLLSVMMIGVAFSRFGLWLFSLAVNQLLQDRVPPGELGAVNGAQGSICSAFETMSYVATLALNRPEQFPLLMLGSCGSVFTGATFVWRYALKGEEPGSDADEAAERKRAA